MSVSELVDICEGTLLSYEELEPGWWWPGRRMCDEQGQSYDPERTRQLPPGVVENRRGSSCSFGSA